MKYKLIVLRAEMPVSQGTIGHNGTKFTHVAFTIAAIGFQAHCTPSIASTEIRFQNTGNAAMTGAAISRSKIAVVSPELTSNVMAITVLTHHRDTEVTEKHRIPKYESRQSARFAISHLPTRVLFARIAFSVPSVSLW